MKDWKKY